MRKKWGTYLKIEIQEKIKGEEMLDKLAYLSLLLTVVSISVSPYPMILLLTYGIHEAGHLIFAVACRAKIKKFKIGGFHLSLSYDCSQISYKKELLVCVGGIALNLLSALLVSFLPFAVGARAEFFILCSICLALMNLYPAEILDGGGALKTILYIMLPQPKAEKISRGVSVFAIILLWLVCVYFQLVFSSNISLFFISVFLLVEVCFSFIK